MTQYFIDGQKIEDVNEEVMINWMLKFYPDGPTKFQAGFLTLPNKIKLVEKVIELVNFRINIKNIKEKENE